jgi:hypothetical protein
LGARKRKELVPLVIGDVVAIFCIANFAWHKDLSKQNVGIILVQGHATDFKDCNWEYIIGKIYENILGQRSLRVKILGSKVKVLPCSVPNDAKRLHAMFYAIPTHGNLFIVT